MSKDIILRNEFVSLQMKIVREQESLVLLLLLLLFLAVWLQSVESCCLGTYGIPIHSYLMLWL